MSGHEHFPLQQFNNSSYDLESHNMDPYLTNTMGHFPYSTTAYSNNIPFTWDTSTQMDAPIDALFDMTRSASNNSMKPVSHEYVPPLLSGSNGSAPSSNASSPYSEHAHLAPVHESYQLNSQNFPEIVCEEGQDYNSSHDFGFEQEHKGTLPYVHLDPHLLSDPRGDMYTQNAYSGSSGYTPNPYSGYSNSSAAPSPAPSHNSYHNFNHVTPENFNLQARLQRGTSVSSYRSAASPKGSISGDDETSEKGRCRHCDRKFKDLKAHLLTHQSERPEKCPIVTCEYHFKGFSRKYDKNRHTLTHYKGTMVCGFCPGSGSPSERTFNRADVFKRHLTQMHGVEQNPPNSKKRSPGSVKNEIASYPEDATGKCSTCSTCFQTAQDFYEHLDDCVLRMVQQVEDSEGINARRLAEVVTDEAVLKTFERHNINQEDVPQPFDNEIEEDDNEIEEDEDDDEIDDDSERSSKGALKPFKTSGRVVIGGNISKNRSTKKNSVTWSKHGGTVGKGRKRRKHYPTSWGMSADKMNFKKRVLCVFDGSRRLLKDDMMLRNEFEVRMKLPESNNYVTDVDVETLKRADAYHNATEEEKGWWMPEQDFEDPMA